MIEPDENIRTYLRQLAEFEPEIWIDNPEILGRKMKAQPNNDLDKLEQKALTCESCELCQSRNKVVFGVGNPHADLMFVGEAPGADEDKLGEPFVGRSGKLLDKIMTAMHTSREEAYIANVLKCRPPDNRNPLPHEAATCMPFLRQQIDMINPKVLVALGLVAATHLLDLSPSTSVKSLRGKILEFNGKPLIVTYHPSALLRNPNLKGAAWDDMKTVMKLMSGEIVWDGA